jgi:hypothetical protein
VSAEAREAGFVAALEGEGAVGIFVGAQDSAVTAVAGVLCPLTPALSEARLETDEYALKEVRCLCAW